MSLQVGDTYMEGHATVAVGVGTLIVATQLPKFEIGEYFKLCKAPGCVSTAGKTAARLSHPVPETTQRWP